MNGVGTRKRERGQQTRGELTSPSRRAQERKMSIRNWMDMERRKKEKEKTDCGEDEEAL